MRRLGSIRSIVLVFIFISVRGFAAGAPPHARIVQSVLPARWELVRPESRVWTTSAFASVQLVGQSLLSELPHDYREYCPQLESATPTQRQNFYVYLLSSMAQLESHFNPLLAYRENFRDRNGRYVMSRGLLQISLESSQNYQCGFVTEDELHQPERNLECGLRILEHWMLRDRRIGSTVNGGYRGGARYWSVLRNSKKLAQIRGWTQDFCRNQLPTVSGSKLLHSHQVSLQ